MFYLKTLLIPKFIHGRRWMNITQYQQWLKDSDRKTPWTSSKTYHSATSLNKVPTTPEVCWTTASNSRRRQLPSLAFVEHHMVILCKDIFISSAISLYAMNDYRNVNWWNAFWKDSCLIPCRIAKCVCSTDENSKRQWKQTQYHNRDLNSKPPNKT